MKPVYQIKEYGSFITGKEIEGYITLPPHIFEQLENFILTNRSKDTDALELMGLSARKGIGKVITAKNYVGIITLSDGTTIEILPKIFSAVEDDTTGIKTKRLLVEMLKTLRDSPYKSLQTSRRINISISSLTISNKSSRLTTTNQSSSSIIICSSQTSNSAIQDKITFIKAVERIITSSRNCPVQLLRRSNRSIFVREHNSLFKKMFKRHLCIYL